jgi:hypothetical protein
VENHQRAEIVFVLQVMVYDVYNFRVVASMGLESDLDSEAIISASVVGTTIGTG